MRLSAVDQLLMGQLWAGTTPPLARVSRGGRAMGPILS
jgi:hypothetical protein